jgi:hypothetical protein
MALRLIDRRTYNRLVAAFREHGCVWNAVSKDTGVSRDFAKTAFHVGWQDRFDWARPISTVLSEQAAEVRAALAKQELDDAEIDRRLAEERAERKRAEKEAAAAARAAAKLAAKEQIEAAEIKRRADTIAERERAETEADETRRRIAEQAIREREEATRARAAKEAAEEAEREKARQQAVEARTQEAQMVRLARGAAIGTLGGTMRLMPALAKLADQLRAAVEGGQIPVDKAANTINQISRTVKDATVAAQVVIELERLHVGAPQAIIGVVQHEISVDEAASAVQEAEAALARARQLGLVGEQNALGGPAKVAEA